MGFNSIDLYVNGKYNLLFFFCFVFFLQKEIFNDLYNTRFDGINRMVNEIDLSNLNSEYRSLLN